MDGSKGHYSQCFLADNKRFADVCNYYLYNGEDVIRPEELLEQDAREILSVLGSRSMGGPRSLPKCCGMRQMEKLETMNFDLSLITG